MKSNLLPTALALGVLVNGAASADDLGFKISLAHDHYRRLYREILRDPEKVGRVVKASGL